MNATPRLDTLAQAHPEWKAWLGVVREVVAELSDPAWDAGAPPATAATTERAPWLAGAVMQPDGQAVARLWDRLSSAARAQGLQALAGVATPAARDVSADALAVFLAAVNVDLKALDRLATRRGATPEGFRTLAHLLPMPCLHACARRWAAATRGERGAGGMSAKIATGGTGARWSQGYCPVCGAWPAFAEVLGIERARQLRCGRCGAGWAMPVLACTYCATTDHETLGTLVVDDKAARFALDVCHGCSGYLKSFTTLQATPSNDVLVVDLASVEFDLVAVERGFLRPPEPGVALHASLAAAGEAPHAARCPS